MVVFVPPGTKKTVSTPRDNITFTTTSPPFMAIPSQKFLYLKLSGATINHLYGKALCPNRAWGFISLFVAWLKLGPKLVRPRAEPRSVCFNSWVKSISALFARAMARYLSKFLHAFFGVSLGPVPCEAVVVDAAKTISLLSQHNRLKKATVLLVHNFMALRGNVLLVCTWGSKGIVKWMIPNFIGCYDVCEWCPMSIANLIVVFPVLCFRE
jgi:hypothetical protein